MDRSLAETATHQKYPVFESDCVHRRARVSMAYRDFSKVARYAERMLQEHDWIWSIWLFGSRARCDARADSDWDLALITSSYKNGKVLDYQLLSPPPFARVAGPIQCHQIPIHQFMEKRLCRGHVAFAVAGEGVPLAQRNWLLPTHQPFEVFRMDHCTYLHYLEQFERGLVCTRRIFQHLSDPSLYNEWYMAYAELLTTSVDLVEGLAKSGCLARDLNPDLPIHEMDSLGDELRSHETDDRFVSLVKSLKGNSGRHNQVRFLEEPSLLDAELAFDRTILALASADNELRTHRDIFEENGDQEALMIHETETHRITGFLSRLDRVLRSSQPPRIARTAICKDYREIFPHIWSRKTELIKVTSVLQRGIDELERGIDNGLER